MWRDPGELEDVWREDRRFEAEMNQEERELLYQGWRAAVERVRADRRESAS
jgi:glycerol kinase